MDLGKIGRQQAKPASQDSYSIKPSQHLQASNENSLATIPSPYSSSNEAAELGFIDLPSLHELHQGLSDILALLEKDHAPFEPEIAEPLQSVLKEEMLKINYAITGGTLKP